MGMGVALTPVDGAGSLSDPISDLVSWNRQVFDVDASTSPNVGRQTAYQIRIRLQPVEDAPVESTAAIHSTPRVTGIEVREVRQLQRYAIGISPFLGVRSFGMDGERVQDCAQFNDLVSLIIQKAVAQIEIKSKDDLLGGPSRVAARSLVHNAVAEFLERSDDGCHPSAEVRTL